MVKRGLFLVSMFVLLAACESKGGGKSSGGGGGGGGPVDSVLRADSSLETQVAVRVTKALQNDSISKAFDTLLDGIVSDPSVTKAGTGYFETLAADPKIAAPVGALLESLGENPQMLIAVQKLMEQNPTATPDQIGDLMGKQFERTWETPTVNAAWMEAWNAFLGKLRSRVDLSPMSDGLAKRLGLKDVLGTGERLAKWNRRITELNGGTRPDTARATELYLETAWSNARIEKFAVKLAANPALRRETATAIVDFLALPSLRTEMQKTAAKLLSDAQVKKQALDAIVVLLTPKPPIEDVRRTLTALMTSPATVDAIAQLLRQIMDDPGVIKIVDKWFENLGKDPQIKADLTEFYDGW